MTTPEKLPAALIWSRAIVLACSYGLLLYFLVSSIAALDGIVVATFVIWLLQILPLLIFLPGLHKSRLRSYAWVSFVVLLYFMHGVLVAFSPSRLMFGLVEVALCAMLFVSLIIFIRQFRDHYGVGL